ncbi:hypothetical protein OpiT1DRAFT_01221 [Opitutaceae bacterium TAV1]|nr:hypothetical protein OpiT1DRAFT_01221 [Opitutaceae bacterium TAV1]
MNEKRSMAGILWAHGCVMAMIISWSLHHSVLWTFLHGFCGWLYVIYFVFTR